MHLAVRHDDHALFSFNALAAAYALITTSCDAAGEGRANASCALHAQTKRGQVLVRNIRRTTFDFSAGVVWAPQKKPDMYWSAPRRPQVAKNPCDFRDRNRLCQEV